ncbi:hypothetical protein [Azohydromonas australica]|uniref:hypothetical protein n=1 Tax=Azohydromonas australica TaxID=364039 RepID=UPI000402F57A|nr:hypothetical protein [Azohydromonas australica]
MMTSNHTRSLADFIDDLARATSPTRTIKNALLRTQPGWLRLESSQELAQLLAFLLSVVHADNGSTLISGSTRAGLTTDEQIAAWHIALQPHPFLSTGSGSPGKSKRKSGAEPVPLVQEDPAKFAAVLADPWSAASQIDLAAFVQSRGFRKAQDSVCTHPVRFRNMGGHGGFVKLQQPRTQALGMMVTEEDFSTRATRTLTCTASYQPLWHVFLPLVDYRGIRARLPDVLARHPELCKQVQSSLSAHGVASAAVLIEALAPGGEPPPMRGEAQVFVGDLPAGLDEPPEECLSVLTPFALPAEVHEAKERLAAAYRAEILELQVQVRQQIKEIDEQLAISVKTGKANRHRGGATKVAQDVEQQQPARLRSDLVAQEQRLERMYLTFPASTIPLGGQNPQNVAMDVTKEIHTANVRLDIPFIRQAGVDLDAAVAYVEEAHLAAVTPPPGAKAPRYLLPQAESRPYRQRRRALFTAMVIEVLAPLLVLRDHWHALVSESEVRGRTLQARDAAFIGWAPQPWRLFVTGEAGLRSVVAREVLAPLAGDASRRVLAALDQAYPRKPWSREYEPEVREVAFAVVMHERT